MYKTVWDLSPEQFSELKAAYFWGEDTDAEPKLNYLGEPALFPGDIPDNVIYNYYRHISFVDDDFCCSTSVCGGICCECENPTYCRIYDLY